MLQKLKNLTDSLSHLRLLYEIRHLLLQRMDPVERHCALMAMRQFKGNYELWRVNRINKVLALLGADWDWRGKSVLELGGGFGDVGAFFADCGANVTYVDARIENLSIAKLRWRDFSNIEFILRDVEEDFSDLGKFDVIIHFGLLYHIDDLDKHLNCCANMADYIFLETEVLDSTDDQLTKKLQEPEDNYDAAPRREVTIGSPYFIKRILDSAGLETEIVIDGSINAGARVYDWPHQNDNTWKKARSRFFFSRRVATIGDQSS